MQDSTEPDGVRVIKHRLTTGDASQFFVSTKPHVVFVSAERWMEIRERVLEQRLAAIEGVAAKCGHRLSRAAILPDHVHLTLGCGIGESPEQVALGCMNACAEACGRKREFMFSYYTGTIGEYDRGAV